MKPKPPRSYILIFTGIFFLICLGLSLNLNPDQKVTALLPETDPQSADFKTVMSQVPSAETLYIQIQAKDPDPQLIAKAGDAFYAGIRDSAFFTDIVYRFSHDSLLNLMTFVSQNKYWLFNEDDLAEIKTLMTKESLNQILPGIKRTLTDPTALASAEEIAKDPLGLNNIILKRLSPFQAEATGMNISGGRIISQDEKSLLIMASPAFPAMDTKQSLHMFALLNQEKQKIETAFDNKISIGFSGVHPATLDNSETIQSDVKRAVLALSIAILVMGFLFFSRFYHVFLIFLPTLVSLTFATAVLSFFTQKISAIALGCGAVLMGITVDFAIHILFYADTLGPKRTKTGIKKLKKPVATGAGTTMAAFGCLAFSSLPGQQQMGLVALAGILGAALFAIFILPYFINLGPWTPRPPVLSMVKFSNAFMDFRKKHMKILGGFCILLFGVSLFGLDNFTFDGDVANLNHLSPDTKRDMDNFLDTWAQTSPAIILVSAPTLEDALKKNDSLFRRLKKMQTREPITNIASLSGILPSASQRKKQLAAFRQTFNPARIQSLEMDMAEACSDHGFSPQAFAPFFQDLKSLDTLTHFSVKDFDATVIAPLIRSKLIRSPAVKAQKDQPETYGPDFSPGKENYLVMTTVEIENRSRVPVIRKKIKEEMPGTSFLDKRHFIKTITDLVAAEFKKMLFLAALSMVLVLMIFQRKIKMVLITITPVCLSAIMTAGFLGLAGVPVNLISIIFIIFVFGVGVDFSIFLVHHEITYSRNGHKITAGAVLLCAMTTLTAFACLAFARHQALFSIGIAGLFGMLTSLMMALVLIPFMAEHWLPCPGNLPADDLPRHEPIKFNQSDLPSDKGV